MCETILILYCFFVIFTEMLRTQTIQKWIEVRETNSVESKIQRTWGNVGDEGPHVKLSWPQGGSLRSCSTWTQK